MVGRAVATAKILLIGSALGVAVLIWPGLGLGNDVGSRSTESTVLMTGAGIAAAAVLGVLAFLGIVLQVMARYSWAVIRAVLPRWFGPTIAGAAIAGVGFPLWISFAPTARSSAWAAVFWGWSMIAVTVLVVVCATRMNPPSLAERTRLRALSVLSRERLRPDELDDLATVLRQVVIDDVPLWGQGRRTAGTFAVLLAALCRTPHGRRTAVDAVHTLAGRADGSADLESGAAGGSIVLALWTLGLDQVPDEDIFTEIHAALTSIAKRARAQARRELAALALDALAGVTTARICFSEPRAGFTIPPRPTVPPPPPAREADPQNPMIRYFASPPAPSSLEPLPEPDEASPLPTRQLRRARLEAFVEGFAGSNIISAAEIGGFVTVLQEGLPVRTPQETDLRSSRYSSYSLLCDTLETMISLLPSPLPSSVGWPSAWMGTGAFDQDIERLAHLVEQVYLQSREVPADVVEEALEQVGVRLLAENVLNTVLPEPRTMWRLPPTRQEEGGIGASTAESLSKLMAAAFKAGFDRRALSTGSRLAALATASARTGDTSATFAYLNALEMFTGKQILHGQEAHWEAGGFRAEAILLGLITEWDQLLAAAYAAKGSNEILCTAIYNASLTLVWRAPGERSFDLAVAMLRARVMAAGWPIELPSTHIYGFGVAAGRDDPIHPLPQPVLSEIESDFPWRAKLHDRLTFAYVLILWAHAVFATQAGDGSQADYVADLLRTHFRGEGCESHEPGPLVEERSTRPDLDVARADSHVRRMVSAAISWCDSQPVVSGTVIPSARKPHTVQAAAKTLLRRKELPDWSYEGTKNLLGSDLIFVASADGSRRALRNVDLRADEFSWGYGGTGPHLLAETLVFDLLGNEIVCPDCLGTIQLTADALTCSRCGNTGLRRGVTECTAALVSRWIALLPASFRATRRELLAILAEVIEEDIESTT